ncbi:cytochrome P450 [Apodospora peruviana]|uniref:Cytochrome P450 n=1 Tax=Apodospora peruviana TaxID=516989 RepID=A0AAE0ITV7_9PEZI|nr:cytochrome P450 [Apodospora peruviana]
MENLVVLAAAWAINRAGLLQASPIAIGGKTSSPVSFFSFAIIAIAIKTCLSIVWKLSFRRRAAVLGCGNAPVYPHKDPVLGMDVFLETLRRFNAHTLLELFRERFVKYGNTFYSIALGGWILNTCEPENIKTILATKMDDWPIAGPRLYAAIPILGSKSVFTTNGQVWHEARAMIRPSFVRDQVADLKCFDRHIRNMIAAVPKDGSTFDMQKLLLAMTMDSSTDFMLGYSTNTLVKHSEDAQRFLEDFDYAGRVSASNARLGAILTYIPNRELNVAVRRVRAYLRFYLQKAIADKAEKKEKTKDLDYVFLDAVLQSGKSEEHIIDQILSIIVAGRDTTAAAMTATFYYLARDPAAVGKLRKEIQHLGVENPTWEQLKNLKYLNNCVKEALRLLPPVATNSRAANKDTVLPRGGGPDGKQPLLVPKGTATRWSLYSLQRRKDIFGPDADEFRPERWDDHVRVGWEYIPFHGGPRVCLGQQFALTQMAYTLFRFFKAFRSIEARENGSMLIKTNITISLAEGCLIGATHA